MQRQKKIELDLSLAQVAKNFNLHSKSNTYESDSRVSYIGPLILQTKEKKS